MNKFCALVAICLLGLPQTGAAKLFNAEEFMLDNGLRVVVIENHKAPLIKQMMWYASGSVAEKYGKGGSAHLLEHLMFRGTNKVKDGEYNRIMNENGVDSNAFTSYDMTVYHQFADISRLEALMALEADRMQNLNFNKKAFETEQKIVFQERKQVVENNPSSPFYERLSLLLWGNLPYGHPITGYADEIMGLTADDVKDFYRRQYAPNNAILVLAGDIDVATAKKLAQKYYASIPAKEVIKQEPASENKIFKERLEMKLPQINTPQIVYKYLLPAYGNLKGNIYDYLVLAEYLGGGQTSVLYNELVNVRKVAVGVAASYEFKAFANSVFSVSAVPASDVSQLSLKMALREARAAALQNLTAEKLEKVKKKMVADLIFANDNPEDAAYWLGFMLVNGFSLEEAQSYADNIEKVTVDGVLQAAKEVFLRSSEVEGELLPLPAAKGEKQND